MLYDDRTDKSEIEIEEENEHQDSDISLEDIEESSKQKIKTLQAKLKESEQSRQQVHEELQRVKADFLNAKRRLEEQKNADIERAKIRYIENILPLADSFEMAMKDPRWTEADESWRKGVEGIYAQLMNTFRAYNVSTIDALGKAFNPHEHEALHGEGDVVTEEYQRGYRMNEIIIRPAKVSVASKE